MNDLKVHWEITAIGLILGKPKITLRLHFLLKEEISITIVQIK